MRTRLFCALKMARDLEKIYRRENDELKKLWKEERSWLFKIDSMRGSPYLKELIRAAELELQKNRDTQERILFSIKQREEHYNKIALPIVG